MTGGVRGADNGAVGDVLVGLAGFAHALRNAGVDCGPERVQAFLRAAEHVGAGSRRGLYWAGRTALCSEPDDLARFDAAFERWFGAGWEPPARRPVERQVTAMSAVDGGSGEGGAGEPLAVAASGTEVLRHRDLADLDPAERARLRRVFEQLRLDPPARSALRRSAARRGELDPRATLRGMSRTAGEPLRLARRGRARRPRRVVLLVDVSGSMEPYADALLRFAHVAVRGSPASTEVFTLGTRMTRVSRQLRHRDPERALAAVAAAVPDFSGGTRLGEALRAFLDRWGQRGVARGAAVVLFSDGWERGDASLLGAQVRRLQRLARAVVWANPHAGRAGYAPVQSGIAAAVPHVDGLVAGHSLDALQRVWSSVLDLSAGRRVRGDVEVRGA